MGKSISRRMAWNRNDRVYRIDNLDHKILIHALNALRKEYLNDYYAGVARARLCTNERCAKQHDSKARTRKGHLDRVDHLLALLEEPIINRSK